MTVTDPRARQLAEAVHGLAREKATSLPAWGELPLSEREKVTAEARLWLRAAVDAGLAPAVVSSPPATDRATVRDRVAEALYRREWPLKQVWQQALPADRSRYEALADAVLAVLPPPADRAAVLLEVADWLKAWRPEFFERWAVVEQDRYEGGVDDAAAELRRLAAEAQPEPAAGVRQPDIETPNPSPAAPAPTALRIRVLREILARIEGTRGDGVSACCGRPPCEFVGERVTRDPDEVTCPGPAAEESL